jgi:L-threonylcarbamoyladenylate synthase
VNGNASPGAEVLQTETLQLFEAAVTRAAQLLRAGEVVAVPTETVYGLAANALDAQAVARIFQIKGRPAHNPIIVHVSSLEMAKACVKTWPVMADKLARAFWPGALTLVQERADNIPEIVAAGGATVGVRWSSHPFMQALIDACGFPLAAPSANLSNQLSPTSAAHVVESLGDKIPLVIDGGQSQVGIESTVLDLTSSPPRLLRPGMIHEPALLAVTGELISATGQKSGETLRSPGQLARHYSPRATLLILSWRDEADLRRKITEASPDHGPSRAGLSSCHIIAHSSIPSGEGFGRVSIIPHDAEAFGRALYAELHECDRMGAELIVVESLPRTAPWQAIADRLNRAAARGDEPPNSEPNEQAT